MKTLIKLLNLFTVCLFAVAITGCANSNKQKISSQKFTGPKIIVILQLPDISLNRSIAIQVHRLPSKKEKARGTGEYRDNIIAIAKKGYVKIRVPRGNYDVFVDTGEGNYGLLGIEINEETKVIKFSLNDLLQ